MQWMDYNTLKVSSSGRTLFHIEKEKKKDVEITAITFDSQGEKEKTEVILSWDIPILDISALWHPNCGMDRTMKADWSSDLCSRTSRSAPVICLYNENGVNRLTFAVSEVTRPVYMKAGIHEEDGTLSCSVKFTLESEELPFQIKLYRNSEEVMFYEVLDNVSKWWEKDCKLSPMSVPIPAARPMYSTWYSFHQYLQASELEEESKLAHAYGFETLIVDDGWQTGDNNRGYAFCGDWEITEAKIPDMKEHVRKVHEAGMKYMVWFSVPFVGINSGAWKSMSDKILYFDDNHKAGVLDPRFAQVREYLLSTYRRAVEEWDIDGLKLDFIDEFYLRSNSAKMKAGMDLYSVEEALDLLLSRLVGILKDFKPDIMIEFRQPYIGPSMRRFSNIFRVGDCPESSLSNRVGSVDIRLLSGDTAVHSDMIMWHREETPENAARLILNSIFATIQLSVKLEDQSPENLEMIRFWTAFSKENEEVLHHGRFMPQEPQNLYPLITAIKGETQVTVVYSTDKVITLSEGMKKALLINASKQTELIIKTENAAVFHICCKDCRGRVHYEKTENFTPGLNNYLITESGLLELEQR